MRLQHIWSVLWISTSWLVDRLWQMIDVPVVFVNHLFDLASVCNMVRELLALSKLCPASLSSRIALPFVLYDLVFLSSKVCMFTCVTSVLVHFPLLLKLAWHCTCFNIIVNATFFLVAIVIYFLGHPWIKTNYIWLHLYVMVDTWHNRRSPFLQYMTHFLYDIPEWILLEQTHVDEQIYVFLLPYFIICDNFFSKKVYVYFWSRYLWTNVELNHENILILV
jgi:hypothetical protein